MDQQKHNLQVNYEQKKNPLKTENTEINEINLTDSVYDDNQPLR